MNDEQLEAYLREIRPAALPSGLLSRLATPPAPGPEPRKIIPWRWAAATLAPLAAAACWWLTSAPAVVEQAPAPRPAPGGNLAGARKAAVSARETRRLAASRDLPVLNPGSPNPTCLRVVQWVDETTYVKADSHLAFHERKLRTQLIPVALVTL